MKYIVVLTDGLADEKYLELGDLSPMEKANIPFINELAKKGEIGLVKTVPDSMAPGSDVANLAVIGYDPVKYHTGRSPLEAISMGINLNDEDLTFRCNLVTLSDEENYQDRTMVDYSAGEITTEESSQLIASLKKVIDDDEFTLHPGISYRHALVWQNGKEEVELTPPHDISGKKIKDHLPKGKSGSKFLEFMEKSSVLLENHRVNKLRVEKGLRPANSVWFWGMGKKTILDSFQAKTGLDGAVISAVDLIKGIAIAAEMKSIDVEGATGNIHTNFEGKAEAALKALEDGKNYVYLHLEAPDECGHQGDLEGKVHSIELIEQKIVKPIVEKLTMRGEDFRMMILPDHPTPIRIKTHTREAVPFVIYDSTVQKVNLKNAYSEENAKDSGLFFQSGEKLADYFLQLEKREENTRK